MRSQLSARLGWIPPVAGVIVLVWMVLSRVADPFPGGIWDLYPLYHGAQNLLEFGDAYRQDAPEPSGLGRVGNPYPLNAVLTIGLPLSWLPAEAAGLLYMTLVGLAWIGSIRYARQSWVWLLWWPMWDAIRLQQASAIVTVAALGAWGAAQRGHKWVFIGSTCLMAAKPQQAIVLMGLLLWRERRWWREVTVSLAGVAALTFIAQPGWLGAWLDRVEIRDSLVQGELWLGIILIPLGILGWWRGWSLSGASVVSTGVAPWPVAGQYVAALWPIGLADTQVAIMCLGSWLGLLATLLTGNYWLLPASMMATVALAWFSPVAAGDRASPSEPPDPGPASR